MNQYMKIHQEKCITCEKPFLVEGDFSVCCPKCRFMDIYANATKKHSKPKSWMTSKARL